MANNITYSGPNVADKNIQLIQSGIQTALAQLQKPGGFPYTPSTDASWSSPAPQTLQDALDRMAALLKTLNGGSPIP